MSSCENCKVSVNLLIRKKCTSCGLTHCPRCMSPMPSEISPAARWTAKNFGLGRNTCLKCALLTTGDYTRDDLSTRYTARELRMFLIRHRVGVDSCKEKDDLIELVMCFSRTPNGNRSADREHAIYVEQLKERMMHELGSGPSHQQPMPNQPSSSSALLSENTVSERVTLADNTNTFSDETPNSSVHQEQSAAEEQNVCDDFSRTAASSAPAVPLDQSAVTSDEAAEIASHETASSTAVDATRLASDTPISGSPQMNATPTRQRLGLDDIVKIGDIETLSVRQLKELLVKSYVDYKGCCERQELIEHVRRLWIEHMRNKNFVSAASENVEQSASAVFEDNICKLCADAAINCVLLECGHMVTCINCGKRLAECPICRRYISRVVHVFRA